MSSEEQNVEATGGLTFLAAMTSIRQGADYSLSGLTLTVNGIALAINDEQFDVAWDVMNEVDGDDSMISPPSASVPSPPEPACYCGDISVSGWRHKHGCPARTDSYCQAHPSGCPEQSSPRQAG